MSRLSRKVELIANTFIGDDDQAVKRVACATRILLKIAMRVDGESEMKTSTKPAIDEGALVGDAASTPADFGSQNT